MPTLEVNGTTLHYEDTGPGSTGETIAFSHGLLWSTELFREQLRALAPRYRCIAWDHRGQGKSASDSRHTIGIELLWQDAVALLGALSAGPVHLAGLSMGGFVAMRLAARNPELVKKLILLETSAGPEPVANVSRYRLLNSIFRVLGPRPIARQLGPIMLGKTVLEDAARKDDVARFIRIMSARGDVWRAVNGVIDRAGITHTELAKITAPTLVIVGSEDVATPPDKAQEIVRAIPGASLAIVPRAGHSSPVEEPEAVTAAIRDFLERG
ncbi:MAG: alpha/beta fold hydrolase [Polyangiaceae bacterium]